MGIPFEGYSVRIRKGVEGLERGGVCMQFGCCTFESFNSSVVFELRLTNPGFTARPCFSHARVIWGAVCLRAGAFYIIS